MKISTKPVVPYFESISDGGSIPPRSTIFYFGDMRMAVNATVIYCEKKTAKKALIAIPPPMMVEVDALAEEECRTRSDLIREALRQYVDNAKRKKIKLESRRR